MVIVLFHMEMWSYYIGMRVRSRINRKVRYKRYEIKEKNMASKKERLDVLLVDRHVFVHREKEQKLIILWQDLYLLMDRELIRLEKSLMQTCFLSQKNLVHVSRGD